MSMSGTKPSYSLKRQLFLLSIASLCIAILFYFFLLNIVLIPLISDINTKQLPLHTEANYAAELQTYISEHNLSLQDLDKVHQWDFEHKYVFIKLFINHTLVYDSIYDVISSDTVFQEEPPTHTNAPYYPLKFSDGAATVMLFCFDELKFYTYVNYLALLLSFLLFFFILSAGVHKKIRYLNIIKNDLEYLSISLQRPITVKGGDEISSVAESIDSLRLSILDKMEKEQLAYKSNRDLITALSHDIRTPLTSLIQYLELTDREMTHTPKTRQYLSISLSKAQILKDLTNELFEYFLLDSKNNEISKELVNGNELMIQMLEENLFDLEVQGISINREVQDITSSLYVNVKLVYRLFNNLVSNIRKYADLSRGLLIQYYLDNGYLVVHIKNFKLEAAFEPTSTNIGLKNCAAIMKLHNGRLEIEEASQTFSISLYFLTVSS